MEVWQSIILGITQGLTEFLPVSSSGHLVLIQNAMGLTEIPLFFDVMLHCGTLIAVVVVLFREIIELFAHPVKNHLAVMVFATVPAGLVGLLLNDTIEGLFSGAMLGICFLITAAILFFSEFVYARIKQKKQISLWSGLAMGGMQAVALFPGISRSGSTIAGGLFSGVNRKKVASFAFLMSIPLIVCSVFLEGVQVAEVGFGDVDMTCVIVGTVFSAVSGFVAVKFMINLINKHKLTGFIIYLIALGAFVLLDQGVFHLIF